MRVGLFSPRFFWPTLFVIFGLTLLIGLGTWQLQRLAWKNDLIHRITSELNQPAMDESALNKCATNPALCEFRQMALEGTYLHGREALLYGRTYGGKPVTYLVTPLKLSSGHILLVERGWVPDNVDMKSLHPVQGKVSLTGYLRLQSSRNAFTPDNSYEKKRLFSVEPLAWAKAYNVQDVLPFYLVLQEMDSKEPFPRMAEPLSLGLRNFHLSYAITWYLLAFALLIVYVFYIRKYRNSSQHPEREH